MTIKPYAHRAQFYETDQMGIIHHSNHIRWFEEARVDFMEQLGYGYTQMTEKGLDFALLAAHCEYKSMARFGETALIQIRLTELGPARATIAYTVTDEKTGKLRAEGYTRHCCYDSRNGRPVSLKKAEPALYELFASVLVRE